MTPISKSGRWDPARLWLVERPGPRFTSILLAAYVAATLFVSLRHEPWRDEADSWLVARDLPLSHLFGWTRYAGTPSLWYLLLKPLASLDLAITAQSALHLLLAWVAATLFLLTAPFTRLTKVLALASYYLAYEYAVVARSYVLTALFLFLLAALYERRRGQPIAVAAAVFVLANANVHGAIFAGMFLLLFVAEGIGSRRRAVAAAVMIGGLAAAWWQLRTPPDAAYPSVIRYIDPAAMPFAIGNAFLPGLPWWASFPIGFAVLVLVARAIRAERAALLLLTGSLALLAILYTFVWMGGYQHAGLVFLTTIASLWMGRSGEGERASAAALLLNATLLASGGFAAYSAVSDVTSAFSGAKEMADFIHRQGLDRYEIACHTPYHCVALAPHLGRKQIWYAGLERHGTFLPWDRRLRQAGYLSNDAAIELARNHFERRHTRWLLVLNTPMGVPRLRGFRLVYATTRPVFRMRAEKYWLYEPLR